MSYLNELRMESQQSGSSWRTRPIRLQRRRAIEVSHPGIPGADNRWYPSRLQARKAALRQATRLGPGHRIVWNPAHAPGQLPHYHVVAPNGRRVSGHSFYGRRPPRKAPPNVYPRPNRRWRESEFEGGTFDLFADGERTKSPCPGDRRLPQWANYPPRGGGCYYRIRGGDNLYKVARRALERAIHPAYVSKDRVVAYARKINKSTLNRHLRYGKPTKKYPRTIFGSQNIGPAFLPRLSKDRRTGRGRYFAVIHLPPVDEFAPQIDAPRP